MDVTARLAAIGTATLGEAWRAARIVDAPPRPLSPGMVAAGVAVTVRCQPGDNLGLHRAIAQIPPDSDAILIVDYGHCVSSGPFGEVMAIACQARGIRGLIITGAVRDSRQIRDLGFPVFATGLHIAGTTKKDQGCHNPPVALGQTLIHPGDLVVADADGIVAIDRADGADAVRACVARLEAEAAVIDRLKAGETTLEIFNLPR